MSERNRSFEYKEKSFDLNIEKILENWDVHHAIREIISNAIDEQILSNSKNIEIYKKDNVWHIVDYGRGLSYIHLTQNENDEKKNNNRLIGRFGVGLKDALATLYRHGVKVSISSKHGVITLDESAKEGFEDIITLHAKIKPPKDKEMIGTDFSFWGCDDKDVYKAKQLFLMFTNNNILETNNYGQIIEKNGKTSYIYINGVKVAEEPNFLFSYNITSLNKQIIKAMNRERTNIGRSAYTERIKNIILSCNCNKVINSLINDLQEYSSGERHDELNWTEIQLYASKKLSEIEQHVAFVTPEELKNSPSVVDDMSKKGYSPVIVSKKLLDKIEYFNDEVPDEEIMVTTSKYILQQQESYHPQFIEKNDLTKKELEIYNKTSKILSLIGGCPKNVVDIKIVQNIYGEESYWETVGLWVPSEHCILIKRSQLSSIEDYAGTLLHECAHAISCADDVSRKFELQLTVFLGLIAKNIILDKENLEKEESNECKKEMDLNTNIRNLRDRISNLLK